MGIFTGAFKAVAVAAAQDVWELNAHASTRVVIREIRIGQYSDAGDAAAELLSVSLETGWTTSGSGGAAVTPNNLHRWTGAPAAVSTLERSNTTVAQDGTGVVLVADSFNIQAGWWYYPPEDERIILEAGDRFVVRITAPADELTVNSTIVFEEIGQRPA
jgi:hypothetical protein